MGWESFKQRVSDSAIDFALSAFWVAVWGAIVATLAAVILFFRGASPYMLVALVSSAVTLALVVAVTGAVVAIRSRSSRQAASSRSGRKGYLDYKIQGQRALGAMSSSVQAATRVMEAVGTEATSGARRTRLAQSLKFGNADELAYRQVARTGRRLERRASAMKLHADKYATDVALFIEGFGKWTEWVIQQAPDQNQRAQLATMLEGMRVSAEGQIPHMQSFMAVVEDSRQSSEVMDLAGGSLVDAITILIKSTRDVVDFCADRAAKLRDKRIGSSAAP
jgi:hypothetical protein